MVERLQGATIAIVNKAPLPAAAVDALPDLKMVAVAATGTNIVDLDACRRRGIVVSNIRGYAEHTVPEHVFALLLALSRNLVAWRDSVQAGRWQQSDQFCLFDHPISDLHGATLGLVGSGSLGNGVARLAEAFGMRVLRAEHKGVPAPRPGYTDFEQVLREADALTLHCPLTPQTAGPDRRGRTARDEAGGAADQHRARRPRRRGGADPRARAKAGSPVPASTSSPPSRRRPAIRWSRPELLALPNFLLTPHVAWASRPAMQALADQLIDNIEAFVAGEPRNRVA